MPLVALKPYKSPRRSAAAQTVQVIAIPSPVTGLNYRDPMSNMAPTDALVLDNFIPKQTGTQLRRGWRYHTEALDKAVGSMFSYNAADPANNKLFAASDGDIFDVTTDPPVVSEAGTGSDEDVWSTTQFATTAGMFLLAVSPGAGYWTYDGSSWTQQSVTNLPADPTSVAVWKNRVWFTIKDSSSVYYLDTVDAITGTAEEFTMGSLLKNGGYIRGLVNWTLDAGIGIDDYLIVVGSEGDIGVWQGTDPSDPSKFSLRGVWYVGPVPTYGKFATSYGGDVMLLSELGLVPMSRLVNGQFSEIQPGPSQKVQSLLSPLIVELRNEKSWDIYLSPANDILVIKLPPKDNRFVQFAMNVNTGAWCTFSEIPQVCTTVLNGKIFFATDSYKIAEAFTGERDGVAIDGEGGEFIDGEVQTAFNAAGTPPILKRFTCVLPNFLARQPPRVKLRLNTQFSFENVAGFPSSPIGIEQAEWDSGEWNLSLWGRAGATGTFQAWIGVTGLGYYGALRMKVRALGGTTNFISWHMMYEPGGLM